MKFFNPTCILTTTYAGNIVPSSDNENPPTNSPILIRATDGKSDGKTVKGRRSRVKFATVVGPDELDVFFSKYAEVCRAAMTALKKRDRSKGKKRRKADRSGGPKVAT